MEDLVLLPAIAEVRIDRVTPFVRGAAIGHFHRSQVRTRHLVEELIIQFLRQTARVMSLFNDEAIKMLLELIIIIMDKCEIHLRPVVIERDTRLEDRFFFPALEM